MKIYQLILTGIVAASFATAHAEFETAFFRGNAGHTGSFPAQSGKGQKKLKWTFQTGDAVVSSPVLSGGRVFIGSLDGSVYALDADSGKKVWSVDTGAPVAGSAAVVDGTVYIASQNGHLYAIDAAGGSVKWDTTMDSNRKPAGSPMVHDGIVYMSKGGNDGYNTIVGWVQGAGGYDCETGREVWKSSSSSSQGFDSPIIYSNYVFTAGGRESYAAYALKGGRPVWTHSRHKSYGSQFACAALADDRFYVVGTMAGSLHAISAVDGAPLWTRYVDPQQEDIRGGGDPGNAVVSSPAVSGKRVFIGSNNGKLICFAADDGERLWEQEFSNKIQSSAAVADGVVYFGCHNGKLYAVDETDGDTLWSYEAGTRIISSPWVAGKAVYFGCDDGAVYCLE